MGKNEAKMQKISKKKYDPSSIEPKWQSVWQKEGIYQPGLSSAKKPFYNLMMFPYPSAEGLHVGNMYAQTGSDIYGRFKRMRGFDVFEPIGLDGFGIHSENYALKVGTHPKEQAAKSEANFYKQMHAIGTGVDWSRTVETYDPEYYKWTQWLFIQFFKAGLAYKAKSPVNFCPSCKTVLADEQVIDGRCERCDTVVEKRELEQWFFKITKYAERLLRNIDGLNWAEKVKIAQRNWIGKSEGARIEFRIKNQESRIEVFTTRPDTLYGATFVVISPEHPFVAEFLKEARSKSQEVREIEEYVENAKKKSELERTVEGKEKTGVFTGHYVTHPLSGKQLPVWIADYVLIGYGTGAIMAVPAHDQRDFDFAKKYDLPIVQVVKQEASSKNQGDGEEKDSESPLQEAYVGTGRLINSEEWNGWQMPKEITKVVDWLEEKGAGKRETNYHLRDWLISRQRYWGPPIPMVHCDECGWQPVAESDLPVLLPDVEDWKPKGEGTSPLANIEEFVKTVCPNCGKEAKRETDVSDTFLDSAWYFFRYTSTEFDDKPFDRERVKAWLPVTMYFGGAEHSVLHLLYARFVTMVLCDLGHIDFEEPFARFYAHGLIIKDGAKMSKSKGNVVIPDAYIKKFGADTLRTYLMFLGPVNQGGDFRDTGIEGMSRFLKRVWSLFAESGIMNQESSLSAERTKMMHKAIKGVTEDLEELRYNTAIAKLMIWYNSLAKQAGFSKLEAENYLKLLAPFAPHMTEELWEMLGNKGSIHTSSWPEYDEKALVEEKLILPVQINGKLRATLEMDVSDKEDTQKVEDAARALEGVAKFLEGQTVKTVVYVPGKVLNFVLA